MKVELSYNDLLSVRNSVARKENELLENESRSMLRVVSDKEMAAYSRLKSVREELFKREIQHKETQIKIITIKYSVSYLRCFYPEMRISVRLNPVLAETVAAMRKELAPLQKAVKSAQKEYLAIVRESKQKAKEKYDTYNSRRKKELREFLIELLADYQKFVA